MSETFEVKSLKRVNGIKKIFKSLEIDDVEKIISVAQEYIVEAKAEEEKRRAEAAEKEAAIKALTDAMEEQGISIEDLAGLGDKPKRVVLPKYRLEKDGEVHEWSGRGRQPLWVSSYINEGGSLTDLAI